MVSILCSEPNVGALGGVPCDFNLLEAAPLFAEQEGTLYAPTINLSPHPRLHKFDMLSKSDSLHFNPSSP
jgi:hypothetical protein